jgi:hypothetical protein
MTLLDQIYIAQRDAGEAACIANLQRFGLIPAPTPADDLQATITRLQGEAKVMRSLLTECAGVILSIDSESEDESDMLDALHEKIVLAIRGSE